MYKEKPRIVRGLKKGFADEQKKSRREGKSVFYSLADGHVRTIIAQGREHIEEDL